MPSKLPKLTFKQIGKNLNVTIIDAEKEPEVITKTDTSEALKPVKEMLKAYDAKPSKTMLAKIIAEIKPVTTEIAVKEEKAQATKVAQKKKTQREIKVVKKQIAKEDKNEVKKIRDKLIILKKLIDNGILIKKGTEFALAEFPSVNMPTILVQKLIDFSAAGKDITPYINFWILALGNPNPAARDSAFEYLSDQSLIVTPKGYIVTYRMVKNTERKNVYTHARGHEPREYYKPGEVIKMPREKCDSDSSIGCSSGYHSGTPAFIGLKKGDGYGLKKDNSSIGTGYVQNFSTSFGDQAIIVLINPMHIVSIPVEDKRKMRSCQWYFARITTVDEVLNHLEDKDYLVFEDIYADIEAHEIKEQLKKQHLEPMKNKSVETSLLPAIKSAKKEKLAELETTRNQLELFKFNNEKVSEALTAEEIAKLIDRRVQWAKR